MSSPIPAAADKLGRPRLFDDETERRMVLDAAVRVMTQSGYAAMSVGAILAEAGLSTSSFYRHFRSKDDLAEALIRRDVSLARRTIERKVAATEDDPVVRLDVWLDALLDIFYDSSSAKRVTVLSTAEILSSSRMDGVKAEMKWMLAEPLADVLRDGHRRGVLFSPTPNADALSAAALISSAVASAQAFPSDRNAAKAHVTRFLWPAFQILERARLS